MLVNGIFTVSGIQAFKRQKNADGTSLSYLHMVFIDFKVPDNCHLFSESALFCRFLFLYIKTLLDSRLINNMSRSLLVFSNMPKKKRPF